MADVELGRYQLLGKAGQGTYSEVFKARDLQTQQLKALKRVRIRKTEDGMPMEFVREVESLQRVVHPNVVRLEQIFVGKTHINLVFPFY